MKLDGGCLWGASVSAWCGRQYPCLLRSVVLLEAFTLVHVIFMMIKKSRDYLFEGIQIIFLIH